MSSIMKNAARLEALLSAGDAEKIEESKGNPKRAGSGHSDCMAKIYFEKENLVVRHRQGLTLALRSKE